MKFVEVKKVNYSTYEDCLSAVKRDGLNLQFIDSQTPEICLEAVKQNCCALQFVKNQTPELCLEAVKKNGAVLSYVKHQTPEICMEAVKKAGHILEFVEKQTPEICLEAVKRNGLALQYVKKQTPQICLEAVKQNGYALQYVKKQTPEICLEAVKQNPAALQYVKKQTSEMCTKAVEERARNFILEYVNEEFQYLFPELVAASVYQKGDWVKVIGRLSDHSTENQEYIGHVGEIIEVDEVVLNAGYYEQRKTVYKVKILTGDVLELEDYVLTKSFNRSFPQTNSNDKKWIDQALGNYKVQECQHEDVGYNSAGGKIFKYCKTCKKDLGDV